jgi:hypothetical protein
MVITIIQGKVFEWVEKLKGLWLSVNDLFWVAIGCKTLRFRSKLISISGAIGRSALMKLFCL